MEVKLMTQEQMDAIFLAAPHIIATGSCVSDKKYDFEVIIHVYKKDEQIFIVGTFAEALDIQKGASAMAELIGWTRHSSCDEAVCHLDSVFDLFNEGFITVKKVL